MTLSLLQAVQAEDLALYGQAASCALLTYEAILGFNGEMRLMWSKSFHSGKLLYFLIKYLTLTSFISVASISLPRNNTSASMYKIYCSTANRMLKYSSRSFPALGAFAQRVPWIASVIITLLTEMTLQLRLYALYQAKRTIKFALLISLFVTIVPMLAVAIVIILEESGSILDIDGEGYMRILCIASVTTRSYIGFWVPALVNEAFLFCLAVYKGAEEFRIRRELGFCSRVKMSLVKGSLLYFLVVFAMLLLTEILWVVGGATYVPFATTLTACVASLMSQHLLLGLRRQFSGTQVETTTLSSFFAPECEPSRSINQGGEHHDGSISEGEDDYFSE